MKMHSKEELNKHKIAGLQGLLYDDVRKKRAVALETCCTNKTYQHCCGNDCGAYSRITGESNSFEPWETVAIEFKAARKIVLAPVSVAL